MNLLLYRLSKTFDPVYIYPSRSKVFRLVSRSVPAHSKQASINPASQKGVFKLSLFILSVRFILLLRPSLSLRAAQVRPPLHRGPHEPEQQRRPQLLQGVPDPAGVERRPRLAHAGSGRRVSAPVQPLPLAEMHHFRPRTRPR